MRSRFFLGKYFSNTGKSRQVFYELYVVDPLRDPPWLSFYDENITVNLYFYNFLRKDYTQKNLRVT